MHTLRSIDSIHWVVFYSAALCAEETSAVNNDHTVHTSYQYWEMIGQTAILLVHEHPRGSSRAVVNELLLHCANTFPATIRIQFIHSSDLVPCNLKHKTCNLWMNHVFIRKPYKYCKKHNCLKLPIINFYFSTQSVD